MTYSLPPTSVVLFMEINVKKKNLNKISNTLLSAGDAPAGVYHFAFRADCTF